VLCVANSRKMVLSKSGLKLDKWKEQLDASAEPSSIDSIVAFVKAEKPLNPVFVDCTATGTLPEHYADVFAAGMHIVTPNKTANAFPIARYDALRAVATANRKRFLYETNVGAGLPVIDTFRNMMLSGDKLSAFSGIMSGSLSYIFGRLDDGVPFSKAVLEAKERGFTEPDPRDDLSGKDVARKALIIAREAGFRLELSDVKVDSVFPPCFDMTGSVADFLSRLPAVDAHFAGIASRLVKEGKVFRYCAEVSGSGESVRVGAVEVALADPLAAVKNGENAFVFTTKYYSPIPLVIRGYGAGADVTASGVFADILRTAKW